MKTSTKLFVAVAALFAFACTTDATEDLGVNVLGPKTLTISLEESRTQLGEKADGIYPLYWSENDQISVNGVVTNILSANEAGSAKAVFTTTGAVEYPYSVVYPASTAGQVTFPATQEYVAGTFASGAAPMYGYAAEGDIIQMNHLVGALRIAVAGEGTLSKAVVKAEKGNLSGTYTIDCATGALTAVNGTTSNAVLLSFGKGLALGATATPLYVAVPAGEYGKVTVILFSTDGKQMRLTFDTTGKPITTGTVREFQEVTFAGEDKGLFFEGDVIITTPEELLQFTAAAEARELSFVTSVTIGATIDMSDIEWNSIKNLPAIIFDGGSDKGYEIKGLSAPLFGTVSGKIKNVKLTGVAITETTYGQSGSIARIVQGGTLNNCYAEGTLVVNNTTYNEVLKDDHTNINIGGLVGLSEGGTFKDCYNKIAITVTSVCLPTSENAYPTSVGGIVGVANALSSFENCTNDAKILYNGTSTPAAALYLCGIIGRTKANGDTSLLKNLTNTKNGIIEFPEGAICGGSLYMRGCVGVVYDKQTAVEDITNYADLKFYGTANGNILSMAGVCGNLGAGVNHKAYRLNNYGNIYAFGNIPNASDSMRISGIATETAGDVTHAIHNCHNYGTITVSASQKSGVGALIAGLIANHTNGVLALNNCVNEGDVTVENASAYKTPDVAGITGYVTKPYDCVDCENKGDITYKCTTTSNTYIAGFFACTDIPKGNADSKLTNCVNSGNITHSGAVGNNLFMGGFVGYIPNDPPVREWINCENKGSVKIDKAAVPGSARAGGFVGGTYATLKFTSCTNSGDVTSSVSSTSESGKTVAAGFVADSESGTPNATFVAADESKGIKPCKNTGTITITGNLNQYARVSGIANLDHKDGTLTGYDLINEGAIVAKDMSGAGYIQAGGVTACHIKGSKWVNATNKGAILIDNVKCSYVTVGGISGHTASGSIAEGKIVNIGDITIQGCTFSSPSSARVGGLVGGPYVSIANAECYCTILTEGLDGRVGMLTGGERSTTYAITNAKVGGAIAVERDSEEEIFKKVELNKDNYYNYLYIARDKTDWTGTDNYDGCTFLEEKPTL